MSINMRETRRDPRKEDDRRLMETRPYFVVGDLIANAGVGALVALAAHLFGGLPIAIAVVADMMLGVIVGLVLSLLLLAPIFGAMEIFVTCTLSGMVAGIVGADMASQDVTASVAAAGAVSGMIVLVAIYAANLMLPGERRFQD